MGMCVKDYGECIYGDSWKEKMKMIRIYSKFNRLNLTASCVQFLLEYAFQLFVWLD